MTEAQIEEAVTLILLTGRITLGTYYTEDKSCVCEFVRDPESVDAVLGRVYGVFVTLPASGKAPVR